jgi:hypothetical protein
MVILYKKCYQKSNNTSCVCVVCVSCVSSIHFAFEICMLPAATYAAARVVAVLFWFALPPCKKERPSVMR